MYCILYLNVFVGLHCQECLNIFCQKWTQLFASSVICGFKDTSCVYKYECSQSFWVTRMNRKMAVINKNYFHGCSDWISPQNPWKFRPLNINTFMVSYYINLNSSYLSLTAVICYSSFKPTSSTLLARCSFIVQPVDGTNLISVWSQFRISFSGISYISNVALISSKFLSSFLQNLSQNICFLLLFPSSGYIIH